MTITSARSLVGESQSQRNVGIGPIRDRCDAGGRQELTDVEPLPAKKTKKPTSPAAGEVLVMTIAETPH